jgi:hypothetical protein
MKKSEIKIDENGKYVTPCCGKSLSKSGYYKHMSKPCPVNPDWNSKRDDIETSLPSSSNEDISQSNDNPAPTPSWADWTPSIEATESLPTPLKVLATTKTVRSKTMTEADLATMQEQSRAVLSLGLTAWDSLATSYAKAITLDEKYLISHSEQEKYLVADAQARYLESRGFYVSDVVGSGVLAGALTAGYILPPLAKAHRKAKRGILSPKTKGRISVLMRRIPVVRRLFKPKKMEVVKNEPIEDS